MSQFLEQPFKASPSAFSVGAVDAGATPSSRKVTFSPSAVSVKSASKAMEGRDGTDGLAVFSPNTQGHVGGYHTSGVPIKDTFPGPASMNPVHKKLSATASSFQPFYNGISSNSSSENHMRKAMDVGNGIPRPSNQISPILSTDLRLSRCIELSSPTQGVVNTDVETYLTTLAALGSPSVGNKQVFIKNDKAYIRFANIRDACVTHRNVQLCGPDWVANFLAPAEFSNIVSPGEKIAGHYEGQLDILAVLMHNAPTDLANVENVMFRALRGEGDIFAFQKDPRSEEGAIKGVVEYADINVGFNVAVKLNGSMVEGLHIRLDFRNPDAYTGRAVPLNDGITTPSATPMGYPQDGSMLHGYTGGQYYPNMQQPGINSLVPNGLRTTPPVAMNKAMNTVMNTAMNTVMNSGVGNNMDANIDTAMTTAVNTAVNTGIGAGMDTAMTTAMNTTLNTAMNAGMNGMNPSITPSMNGGMNTGMGGSSQVALVPMMMHNSYAPATPAYYDGFGQYGGAMPAMGGGSSLMLPPGATNMMGSQGYDPIYRPSLSLAGRYPNRRGNVPRVERSNGYTPNSNHNQVDIVRIRAGIDVRTTIMLRNIPNKVDLRLLKAIIDESSWGKYDFVYLRIDFANDCNVGYAFINFADPLDIIAFWNARHNQPWNCFRSDKIAEISYATIQGRDCLIQKFRNSSVMLEAAHYRPKLYYTLNGPTPELAGREEAFPGPDNPSKMRRSCENAEHIGTYNRSHHRPGNMLLANDSGLFTPHAGQYYRDEQRRRRSQYDRGTRMAALEEYSYGPPYHRMYMRH